MMSFFDAIKTCLTKKYFGPEGRATRAEFWWFQLFVLAIPLCLAVIADFGGLGYEAQKKMSICIWVFHLFTLIPYFSVFVRRLHDRGYSSGFWRWSFFVLLLLLIFRVIIWQLALCLWLFVLFIGLVINMFGSDKGSNKYGPNPNEPINTNDNN